MNVRLKVISILDLHISFIFQCFVVSSTGMWALFCYFQHLVIVDVYLSLEHVLLMALHLFQDLLIRDAFMELFALSLKSFIEILASIKIQMLLIWAQIIHIDWIPKLGQLESHNTLLHGCDLIIIFLVLALWMSIQNTLLSRVLAIGLIVSVWLIKIIWIRHRIESVIWVTIIFLHFQGHATLFVEEEAYLWRFSLLSYHAVHWCNWNWNWALLINVS